MEGAGVSEIHRYPLRPQGFEEPLFSTRESRRAVAEHLLGAPWLCRASEVGRTGWGGRSVHASEEPVEVERRRGRVLVLRPPGRRQRRRGGERKVVETLARWREVGGWWNEEEARDRVVVRALLSDGAIVDLAREDGAWSLVGTVD
ncbi:MAG: hypothetical protein CYG60_08070 [Actinobacteria bacterium]|nr:hypothetical protein [Actinomycetota bacterium]PLS86276.1 MAG: hypothetical protein CYG60_08070 [Actinomycetota bacterium]